MNLVLTPEDRAALREVLNVASRPRRFADRKVWWREVMARLSRLVGAPVVTALQPLDAAPYGESAELEPGRGPKLDSRERELLRLLRPVLEAGPAGWRGVTRDRQTRRRGGGELAPNEAMPLPAPSEIADRTELTRREAEVAVLLGRRKTNREMAQALVISSHTARHHTERVFRKLGVRSRRRVRAALEEALAGGHR